MTIVKPRYLKRPLYYGHQLFARAGYLLRTGYLHTEERDNPDFGGVNFERHQRAYRFCACLVAGADVLDIGCGCGTGAAELARSARSVCGIDVSEMALRFAKRRYARCGNLAFRRMDACALEFAPASFDWAVSNENIEHLVDVGEHVQQVAGLLRPEGCFFIGTPDPKMTTETNRFHVRELAPAELVALLGRHFRSVVTIEPDGPFVQGGHEAPGGLLRNDWSYFVLAQGPLAPRKNDA